MTNIKELQKKITAKFVPVNKKHIKDCIKKYESYFLKYERLPHMLSLSKKYDQFEFCMKDIPNGTDTIILIDKNVNMKDENEMGEITITLNYKYFNSSEIFDMLKIPNVGSFQMIGHIIHLNLIPEQYEYKKIYGEVFLMKNKNIKSVIYKTNSVHGIYRTFQFEVIAGIDDLKTVHTENNINYYIDYEKVYWNSKLSAERMKLVTKCFKKGDIIADCTCGAGPLALLAAKMDFKVFANDLNPHAIECIKKSIKKNKKINSDNIVLYNMTSDDFICEIMKDNIVNHFVFNLPEVSLELLYPLRKYSGFTIHAYFFCRKNESYLEYARKKVWFEVAEVDIKYIRNVSIAKDMYKLTKFIQNKN